jgi:hypothetical protein
MSLDFQEQHAASLARIGAAGVDQTTWREFDAGEEWFAGRALSVSAPTWENRKTAMSASYEWTEWHLTPAGWIRGSERTDFSKTIKEPPTDRVLTVTYTDENSGYSAHQSHSEDWRGEDADSVAALLEQYGPAPKQL